MLNFEGVFQLKKGIHLAKKNPGVSMNSGALTVPIPLQSELTGVGAVSLVRVGGGKPRPWFAAYR